MNQFEHISFAVDGAIARIQLNRPDAAHGIDSRLARELKEAARQCDANPALKVVILGATGRFFCAGGEMFYVALMAFLLGRRPKAINVNRRD